MAVDGRQAALDNALKQIEKDFGKGAIMRLGEAADRMNVEVISSGSLAIDIAVGEVVSLVAVLLKSTVQNPLGNQQEHFTL